MSTTSFDDPFWGDQPDVLIQADRLREFFPTADQTLAERMNAITRLVIYSGIALAVYQEKAGPLQLAAIIVFFLYHTWQNRQKTERAKATVIEKFDPNTQAPVIPPRPISTQCTPPTFNNPYMNFLQGDDVTRGPACSGPGVQEVATNLMNRQLFEDVDALYEKSIGQRQFYTMPSTTAIPDRDTYINWLCKDIPNRKQDPTQNYPPVDLRRYSPPNTFNVEPFSAI